MAKSFVNIRAQEETLTSSSVAAQTHEHHGVIGKGYGAATAHHGELFQGILECGERGVRRGLVSLPCSIFKSEATFILDSSGVVSVFPEWKVKAHRAAELTLNAGRQARLGGVLKILSDIPIAWGLGSSTSDVTAAILAVSDALGEEIESEAIARLAVQAETASDSIMFMFNRHAVLFAQREGEVIEDFGGFLPTLEVLGFNTDPSGLGIDTLSFPEARYSLWEIEAFRPLLGLLRRAIDTQNPYLLGQVASASAEINQSHLPKPHYNLIKLIAEQVQALGLQVAHSGTVVGLLFDPCDSRTDSQIKFARTLLAEIGFKESWRFKTPERFWSRNRKELRSETL